MALSSLPSNLRETLPNPKTPWHFNRNLFDRVRGISSDKPYKTAEVLPADPEAQFILKYFEYHKPPSYGIKRIVCIHNPVHTMSFEAGIKNIDEEIKSPASTPKWRQEDMVQERAKVMARWEEFTSQFSPFEIPQELRDDKYEKPKVVPMWHGSSKKVCEEICASNFRYFGKHHFFTSASKVGDGSSTDIGYFGSGIYFTNSVKYAAMYSPQGIIILAWVAMREPYPVVADVPYPKKCQDMLKLQGKEPYQNYNAHYIPVAPINPKTSNCAEYYPCYKNQVPSWDELVVFQQSQALPRFYIELGVDLPLPLSPAPEIKNSEAHENKKAFFKYQEDAKKKDPEAQFNLGMCYLHGKGVSEVPKEAVKWFQKAAAQKHAKATFQLGICHATGLGVPKNEKEAFLWYQKAAEIGLAEAQVQVGAHYFKGREFLKEDLKEAVRWYQKAAAQNFPLANYYLGSCLLYGKGIAQNTEEGLKLHFKAAEQGVVAAQYYLGCFYRDGRFISKDPKKALEWFQKAAAQGDKDANTEASKLASVNSPIPAPLNTLSVVVASPIKAESEQDDPSAHFKTAQRYALQRNYTEAAKFYELAAKKGHAEAQCQLGVLLFKGLGVPKNWNEAVQWYQKAAEQDFPLGTYYLGSCLVYGRGIAQSTEKGIKLYFKAAERGVIPAQYWLGCFHRDGNFLPKDLAKALEWFQKAAAQGDKDSKTEASKLTTAVAAQLPLVLVPDVPELPKVAAAEQKNPVEGYNS